MMPKLIHFNAAKCEEGSFAVEFEIIKNKDRKILRKGNLTKIILLTITKGLVVDYKHFLISILRCVVLVWQNVCVTAYLFDQILVWPNTCLTKYLFDQILV
jgi:hypothetical protein